MRPGAIRHLGLVAAIVVATAAAGCLTTAASAAGISVGFQQPALAVAPGDTFTVELVVPEAGDEFNAFDAAIRFDPARLAFGHRSSWPRATRSGAAWC